MPPYPVIPPLATQASKMGPLFCSLSSFSSPLGGGGGTGISDAVGAVSSLLCTANFSRRIEMPIRAGWMACSNERGGGSVSFLLFCRFPIRSVACFLTSSERASEGAGNSFAARGRRRFSPSLNPSQGLEAGFVLCPLLLRPSLPKTPVQCPSNSRNYQGVSMSELLSLKK